MTLQKLPNGSLIPSIGLGTYNIANSDTSEVVYQACLKGYRHFDTAVLYGNEVEVGQGILKWIKEGNSRHDIFYTTKLWNSQCGYIQAKRAIDECLDKVKDLAYIDLLLIHSPLCGPAKRLETWKAMQEAVDDGKVKNIGVSNYGDKHIQQLLDWKELKYYPQVNQIEISPWIMRAKLVKYCHDRNIRVEAYAPLTHGYKLKNPPQEVKVLMDKYNKTSAQILIRWSVQKGLIPLPKTTTIGRLLENLNVDFELTSDEIKSLDHPDSYEPTDWECTDAP